MKAKIAGALFAMVALPVAAQPTDAPRVNAPTAKVEAKATKKDRTRLAHSQNKQGKKTHRQKHNKQKQAPAT